MLPRDPQLDLFVEEWLRFLCVSPASTKLRIRRWTRWQPLLNRPVHTQNNEATFGTPWRSAAAAKGRAQGRAEEGAHRPHNLCRSGGI